MSSVRKEELEELQRNVGVKFSSLNLLDQALTHASHANQPMKERSLTTKD